MEHKAKSRRSKKSSANSQHKYRKLTTSLNDIDRKFAKLSEHMLKPESIEHCAELLSELVNIVPPKNKLYRKSSLQNFLAASDKAYSLVEKLLAEGNDKDARMLIGVVNFMTIGATTVGISLVKDEVSAIQRKLSNLAQNKSAIAKAQAISHAEELWLNDSDQDLRVGEVVKMITPQLKSDGFGKYTDNTVRGWLKGSGVVPEYARKPGRSKKQI